MITALSETSLTSLKEKIFYHKTRAPFKNSLQKSYKLIRLFNYALLASLSVYLSSLKIEVKTNWPHQEKSCLSTELSISLCFLSTHTPSWHDISSAFYLVPSFLYLALFCASKNNLSSSQLPLNLSFSSLYFLPNQ